MAWQQARLEAMSDSPKEPASEEPGISWLKKDQGSTNSLNVATGTVKQAMQTEKGMWNAVFRGDLADLQKLVAAQGPDILYEKGALGETVLHQCILFHKPQHIEMAKWLIVEYPKLIDCLYTTEEYKGEHALHLAVVKKNFELVKFLIENGADAHFSHATGKFFSRDGGTLYYGETVVAFAACVGDLEILDYLIDVAGCDVNRQDSNGNSVLHILAWWGITEVYDHILQKKVADESIVNEDGHTPFLVAVSRGHLDLVDKILDNRKITMWVYGPVSCMLYPLDELDTFIDDDAKHSEGGILIAAGRSDANLLSHPLFDMLLQAKWKLYGQSRFLSRFIYVLLYLFLFTAMIELLPDPNSEIPRLDYENTPYGWARCGVEVITVVVGVLFIMFTEVTEIWNQGIYDYFFGPGSLENIIQWTFWSCLVLGVVFRVVDAKFDEDACWSVACIVGFLYLLYFGRGFRSVGPLTIIFFRVLSNDLIKWILLYLTFLLGFSGAFHLLIRQRAEEVVPGQFGSTIFAAYLRAFRFTLGDNDWDLFQTGKGAVWLRTIIYVLFLVFTAILLLNVLIAMLSLTFGAISELSEATWRVQWANTIMNFDVKFSKSQKKKFRVGFKHKDEKYYLMVQTLHGQNVPSVAFVRGKNWLTVTEDAWNRVVRLFTFKKSVKSDGGKRAQASSPNDVDGSKVFAKKTGNKVAATAVVEPEPDQQGTEPNIHVASRGASFHSRGGSSRTSLLVPLQQLPASERRNSLVAPDQHPAGERRQSLAAPTPAPLGSYRAQSAVRSTATIRPETGRSQNALNSSRNALVKSRMFLAGESNAAAASTASTGQEQ